MRRSVAAGSERTLRRGPRLGRPRALRRGTERRAAGRRSAQVAAVVAVALLVLAGTGCIRLTPAPLSQDNKLPSSAAMTFESALQDPAADVVHGEQFLPVDLGASPGLDLVSVDIAAAYGTFNVSWRTTSPVPAAPVDEQQVVYDSGAGYQADRLQSLSWNVSLSSNLVRYEVQARLAYVWEVTITRTTAGNQQPSTEVLAVEPTINGDRLNLSIPMASFNGLASPFRWNAWTYWSIQEDDFGSPPDSFMDAAPGEGISDPNAPADTIEVNADQ